MEFDAPVTSRQRVNAAPVTPPELIAVAAGVPATAGSDPTASP